ncbi:MAG: tetratricopeptide repeat protein [Pyrinomonadaceae bacterium]
MHKRILIGLLSLSLFLGAVQAQDKPDERKILTDKAETLFQQGKLDEAIETADKVVDLEKNIKSADTVSYTNALINSARMKRDYFLLLRKKFQNREISPRASEAASDKMLKMAKEADADFHLGLQLNEQGGRGETAQTADIKSDLAWLLYNYIGSRQSIDDAEKLFLESLALNEKTRGNDADETLFVALKTGDFYYELSNYEKALPFYERYIQTNEKNYGKNFPNLINALRPLANILFAAFQEQEAADVLKRIETITGKKEEMPKAGLNFHLRSKESVAVNTKVILDFRKDMELFRAKLKAENRTLNGNNVSMMPKMAVIPVSVVVDENGKIIEAVANPRENDKDLKEKAEQEVSKWNVRPFSYNGTPRKLRGVLYYRQVR